MTRFGSLVIDRSARTVTVAGAPVELTGREHDLLCLLASEPGTVFTRQRLLRSLWQLDNASSRTLDTHACRLRKKLADAGADGLIANVWGIGYRL